MRAGDNERIINYDRPYLHLITIRKLLIRLERIFDYCKLKVKMLRRIWDPVKNLSNALSIFAKRVRHR